MGSGHSKSPAEHATPRRAPRNSGRESDPLPSSPPDPDRGAKAYAVWAMHGSVMTKGFVGFVATAFGVTRGSLYNRQTKVSEYSRMLLSEHGKEVRDDGGLAELPAGSDAWLMPDERVHLGLAKHALTKEQLGNCQRTQSTSALPREQR